MVTPVHAVPPTVIPVAPVKLVPVMVMDVPPAVDPLVGETEATVGAATGVNEVELLPVPTGFLTLMVTGTPITPAGTMAVI